MWSKVLVAIVERGGGGGGKGVQKMEGDGGALIDDGRRKGECAPSWLYSVSCSLVLPA